MKTRATECLERGEALLDRGDPAGALEAFGQAVLLEPGFEAFHGRAAAQLALGRHADALADFDNASRLRPNDVAVIANRANALQGLGRYGEALEALDKALALRPGMGVLLLNRANLLQEMGRLAEALAGYGAVLAQTPENEAARNNRGNVLHKMGRYREALADFDMVLAASPGFGQALYNRGRTLCESGRIDEGFSSFMRAAEVFGHAGMQDALPHKLRHDAEQKAWMERSGIDASPDSGHVEGGGRVAGNAINPANSSDVTHAWKQNSPQLVVVDDLLTPQALKALRRFCLASDIWRKSYSRGYLGAFPESGFACPLLAQIAEEFRGVFPAIFGAHPLVYLWAFKYDSQLRGIEVHADQAAVNVNFWITPDDANLDPQHGGLVVWDQAAPLDWDFGKFNADIPAARDFLARSGAKPTTIPYRANRAVIFDSDLFHETDAIHFREGYENRRINCTLLYGFRHPG